MSNFSDEPEKDPAIPVPGDPEPTSDMPPAPSPEAATEAVKKEAAANYDRYVRAVADLDNYRRRAQREKEETRQYALTGVFEDLIPVIDNFTLSLAAAKQQTDAKPLIQGVNMVTEQLKSALTKHGLKEINPAGEKFDPKFHESIAHQPSSEVAEEHIIQVTRAGYSLNGRLLRPASVVVSSGSAKEDKR